METIDSFQKCRELLKERPTKKLAFRTYLYRYSGPSDIEYYYIKYINTIIAEFYPDRVQLRTNGWTTFTTKNRLNRFTPVNIYQYRKLWYIAYGDNVYNWKEEVEINYKGEPLNINPV